MRQAITTRFLPVTDTKPARIKAIARKKTKDHPEMSLLVSYQYSGSEREHTYAAQALAMKLGWAGVWIGGGAVAGDGYVYVNCMGTLPKGEEGEDYFIA